MEAVAHAEHAHPGVATYLRVALILFVLTAAEVALYEVTRRGEPGWLASALGPIFVETLLVLSAAKFVLVAMFYMHLKSDGKLLSGLFTFSVMLAALIIASLMILFSYLYQHSPTANPLH